MNLATLNDTYLQTSVLSDRLPIAHDQTYTCPFDERPTISP